MVSKADRLFAAGKIDAPERDRRNAQSKRDLKGGGAARKQPVARRRAGRASGGAAHHLRHSYATPGWESGKVVSVPLFAGLPATYDAYRRVALSSVWVVVSNSLGSKEENARFAACFSVQKPKGTETFADILAVSGHVVAAGAMVGRKVNLPLRKDDRKEWRKDGKPLPTPSSQLYLCLSMEWAAPASFTSVTTYATFDCVGDSTPNTSL